MAPLTRAQRSSPGVEPGHVPEVDPTMWWLFACSSLPAEPAEPASAFVVPAPPPAAPWVDKPRAAAPDAPRGDDPIVEAAIDATVPFLDTPWRWEGRGTDHFPGVDCLGLVFRAYGTATGADWRRYEVNPSELVKNGRLGRPVPGLDGVLRGAVDYGRLRRGDVVYFLTRDGEIPDAPLWTHDGHDYWPWHVGLYVDEGHRYALNAHPTYDVVRMPIDDVQWDALFVTRPSPTVR